MSLEAITKYFFAKSTMISDSPRATASESLTGTDWMAALGLADLKSGYGLDLFLAKMGISQPDRAVQCLFEFALSQSSRYRAVAELDEDIKRDLLQILATFAYQDYSRSAASVRECECCKGKRFIDAEVFTNKVHMPYPARQIVKGSINFGLKIKPAEYEVLREVRDVVRVLCHECKGKGVISNACRCHGKGKVLDKLESERQGVPVMKDCPKCQTRGYARLKFSTVLSAVQLVADRIGKTTGYDHIKPFYELLVTECHKQEAMAESMLSKVTR